MVGYRRGIVVALVVAAAAALMFYRHLQFRREVQRAVDAFASFDARLSVGMNYRDYTAGVGELAAALERLDRTLGSARRPVRDDLEGAFLEYSFALDVWRAYMESEGTHEFFPASTEEGTTLIRDYHVKTTSFRGHREFGANKAPSRVLRIYLPDALSAVWEHAHDHVVDASKHV